MTTEIKFIIRNKKWLHQIYEEDADGNLYYEYLGFRMKLHKHEAGVELYDLDELLNAKLRLDGLE